MNNLTNKELLWSYSPFVEHQSVVFKGHTEQEKQNVVILDVGMACHKCKFLDGSEVWIADQWLEDEAEFNEQIDSLVAEYGEENKELIVDALRHFNNEYYVEDLRDTQIRNFFEMYKSLKAIKGKT